MNYLAHAFLSKNDEELLIGNFIADHLRGNHFEAYSKKIVEGILMHRRIDSFTDAHPEFKKAKRVFYQGFEKYSGVLVDIYFDHLLARNFNLHSNVELQQFAKNTYGIYIKHQHQLPSGSQRFLEYVIKNNIYVAYADLEEIKTVLYHLSHRIHHGVQLDQSVQLFKQHEKELEQSFSIFFSEIRSIFHV